MVSRTLPFPIARRHRWLLLLLDIRALIFFHLLKFTFDSSNCFRFLSLLLTFLALAWISLWLIRSLKLLARIAHHLEVVDIVLWRLVREDIDHISLLLWLNFESLADLYGGRRLREGS